MSKIFVRRNAKSNIGNFEVSCYGEKMIMIDHPVMRAPEPVGPKNPDKFWEKSDEERAKIIIDYLENSIDFRKTDPMVLDQLLNDIAAVRKKLV